MKFATKT